MNFSIFVEGLIGFPRILMYDYLIVGSGLYGSVFAYFARKAGKRCLVIEKRSQLGGNVRCDKVEGINIHKSGPHIFHTSSKAVWDFVNSFVPFNRFTYCPVANFRGELYNLPFNMNTFYRMWGVTTPAQAEERLAAQRAEVLAKMRSEGVSEPRNLEEQAMLLVGKDIYGKLVKGYTEKQWGRSCTELPAFIIKRLPVRMAFDNNYFNDAYQGIPVGGYNRLIDGLLAGVECMTGVDFLENRELWRSKAEKLVYTGPIDAYFDHRFGHLEWRTVRFEQQTLDTPNFQGDAVVNYTDRETPWTRIIEHKHFETFGAAVYDNPRTVISREFSSEWVPGAEPFYPVNDEKNNALYQRYKALADCEDGVHFGGRLAEYKYYDMAPLIETVMERQGCFS